MANELVPTAHAINTLKETSTLSFDDFAKPVKQSMLLVDVSGSMADYLDSSGARKIDELRKVVKNLRETHPVPVATFGGRGSHIVDNVPEPSGGTPLHVGIDFAKRNGATHLVVVSDGQPDSDTLALEAAKNFGGPIDVFFVGEPGTYGEDFLNRLAKATGGGCNTCDLGEVKQLTKGIAGLLGSGTPQIEGPRVIQL